MEGYASPSWQNDASPAINAAALSAIGEAIELSEHPYGVCSTAAATAAKTVTIDFSGTLALFTGLTVRVKFTNVNTAANPTLNVNGTGAVPIMAYGTSSTVPYSWDAGDVVTLVYDGTNFIMSNCYPIAVMTSAQYTALSASDKAKDIIFVITDDETPAVFQPLITANGVLIGDGAGGITSKTLDTSSLSNDNNHIPTSGVVKGAMSAMLKYISVQLPLSVLGTSWSPTSRYIGTAQNWFGMPGSKILSIAMYGANFSPAANAIFSLYNDDIYVAATQNTTLSDTNSDNRWINVIYHD